VALREQDSDRDGDVDANDANFGQLRVWVDADKDGVTDAGELKTLTELGISSLGAVDTKDGTLDNGNVIGLVSSYTKTDGSSAAMADVWFAKDVIPPAGAELLAPAAGSVPLPGAQPSDAAPPPSSAAVPLVIKRPEDDELLNRLPPLI
jgi:trimeric autotransporter adhesin